MMFARVLRSRTGAVLGGTALAAVLAGSMVGPAAAAPEPGPSECPATLSSAQATPGLVGEGLVVVRGKTPEPFRVEVLGVLADGIAAGRDLVLIKVSDLPGRHVVDQGGGIWAGMSGAPVYVGGKLLGAVSYGFTLAPSRIGGLTPAADMADLLDLSTGKAHRATATRETPAKGRVTLSPGMRREVGARAEVAVPSGSLEPLPSPFGVSGITGARLKRLQKDAATAGLPLRVYAAARADAPAGVQPVRPVAGGNFASVHSYGDVSAASFGTTTYVCGNRALAFGHEDQRGGQVRYGANDADTVTIVKDNTVGSFTMANVAGSFGTVDQDRLTGIRADLSTVPSSVPITTTVHNLDTGRERTGTTKVVDRAMLPELTPYAVWANLDATFDEYGDGRLSDAWTITGTRAGGKEFSVHRDNKWADHDDITVPPVVGLAGAVYALTGNDEERVDITSVTYDAKISTTFRQVRVTRVELSVDGGKTWTRAKSVRVKAGKKLSVRTTVKPYQGTTPTRTVTTVKVPKSATGLLASLSVTGGADTAGDRSDDTSCLFEDSCDVRETGSLTKVIDGIESAPRNDDLVVALRTGSDERADDSTDGGTVLASRRVRQPEVVTGSRTVAVQVR